MIAFLLCWVTTLGLWLSWVSDAGYHEVWRSEEGWPAQQVGLTTGGKTYFWDPSVYPGTTYCYFVRGRDMAPLLRPFSNVACATTQGRGFRVVLDFGPDVEYCCWDRPPDSRKRGRDFDARRDTFVFAYDPATLSVDLPNGEYTVHLVACDPDPSQDHGWQSIIVEDTPVINEPHQPGRCIYAWDVPIHVESPVTVTIGAGYGATILSYLEFRKRGRWEYGRNYLRD
jgi:hypothetical protein